MIWLAFLTIVICFFILWKLSFNYNGAVKFNLTTFRKIYKINPNKWSFKEKYADEMRHLYYDEHTRVKLSFLAFLWFLYYQATKTTQEKKRNHRNAMIAILSDCQKDIERLKKRSEQEIQLAIKKQKEIFERWV